MMGRKLHHYHGFSRHGYLRKKWKSLMRLLTQGGRDENHTTLVGAVKGSCFTLAKFDVMHATVEHNPLHCKSVCLFYM